MTETAGLMRQAAAIRAARDELAQAEADTRAAALAHTLAYYRWQSASEIGAQLEAGRAEHPTEPMPVWARTAVDSAHTRLWDTLVKARANLTEAMSAREAATAAFEAAGGQR